MIDWFLLDWHWAIIAGIIAFFMLTGWVVISSEWF